MTKFADDDADRNGLVRGNRDFFSGKADPVRTLLIMQRALQFLDEKLQIIVERDETDLAVHVKAAMDASDGGDARLGFLKRLNGCGSLRLLACIRTMAATRPRLLATR